MNAPIRWSTTVLPLIAAAALPAGASAATAPNRYVAFTPSGEQSIFPEVLGVSSDGSEVLLNVTPTRTSGQHEAVIFNAISGTTTPLLPGNAVADGVSTDLKRVLFETASSLDPADTNPYPDLYVYDRTTGKSTLVSRAPSGVPSAAENYGQTGLISGDGKSVVYSSVPPLPAETLRYDLTAGTATVLSTEQLNNQQRLDTAGRVVVTSYGFLVGTKYTAFPASTVPTGASLVASPDGSYLGARSDLTGLQLVNTSTGAVRTVPLPSATLTYGFSLIQVANGGASVVIGTSRGTGSSLVASVDRVNTTTGALTQIGPDVPYAAGVPNLATSDLAFAVSSTSLVQLGATPIPGGTGTPAPTLDPTEYTYFRPGCSYGNFFSPAVKAAIGLVGAAKGSDPHVPTKAVITVNNADGAIVNQFTLKPNARANITPATGGFTYSAAVTFSDGITQTGTKTVASYTPIKNTGTTISNFFDPSACYSANR